MNDFLPVETIRKFLRRAALILLKVVAAIFFVVVIFFVFFNLPGPSPRRDVSFGVTFSSRFARDMGLDPRETLDAILRDLGVRRLRIPVYWDSVEANQGKLDFSDVDWQLDLARRYGAEVILSVGQKVPRWPECFVPAWASRDETTRNDAAALFIARTINRYRSHSEISLWQIENEPFLSFGICRPLSPSTLRREVLTARLLDGSRQVLTTDSGELSTWISAASIGDVFGTTLYRRIWNARVGYITYPVGPNFFLFKKWFAEVFSGQKNFMVIELQAEPWAPGSLREVSLDEQWKTMDSGKLLENVEYARRIGFSDVYLWGAEWWYWLKVSKGENSLWNAAKAVFSSSR